MSDKTLDVYLEHGSKRTVAGVLEWPGWCRVGQDEDEALQSLVDYAPRYAKVARAAKLTLHPPKDVSAFHVVERLEGNATTDYGVPGGIPPSDTKPVDDAELKRLQKILRGCWAALGEAIQAAAGKELRKGPRGGGRDVERMVDHVLDAEKSYLGQLGWKYKRDQEAEARFDFSAIQQAEVDALAAAMRGELPERGPRGGLRWPPHYFVRRAAWHILDHAWEIEDRIE